MKNKIIISLIAVIGIGFGSLTFAEGTGTIGSISFWKKISGYLVPVTATDGLKIPSLASSDECLVTNAQGVVSTGACGGVTGWASTTDPTSIYFTGSGKVGIGTNAPTVQLNQKSTAAMESAVIDGELLSDTGWTSTNWTGDFATGWKHTTGNTSALSNTLVAVNAAYYQISYTVTERNAGSFTITYGGVTSPVISATGAWGPKAVSTGAFSITPLSTFDGKIVISVKRISAVSPATYAITDSSGTNTFEIRSSLATLFNTFVGERSGSYNTTGAYNSANGYRSLFSNTTGTYNTASGMQALFSNTTGTHNSANGMQALAYNTTGYYNTASGMQALYSNTTGTYNTANGMYALRFNTTGTQNTANGYQSLYSNTTGYYNTASGMQALYSNTTGAYNSVIGYQSLYDLGAAQTAGAFNIGTSYTIATVGTTDFTAIGASANTVGVVFTASGAGTGTGTATPNGVNNNVAIGYNTGRGIIYGTGNTILGANVTGLSAGLTNNVIIADSAGNRRINVDSTGNVGINTVNPYSKLSVWGANTSSGTRLFELTNSASTTLMSVQNDGTTAINGDVTISSGIINKILSLKNGLIDTFSVKLGVDSATIDVPTNLTEKALNTGFDTNLNGWAPMATTTIYDSTSKTYSVVTALDGGGWLDRNLGATRVANATNDTAGYGYYYQWGRLDDGHQLAVNGTPTNGSTTTLATSDTPGHNLFIKNETTPYDWRNPKNDTLWQGVNGINNPCPSGFRLPTSVEWQALVTAEGIVSPWVTTAFNSTLHLPVAGNRNYSDATMYSQGSYGTYWSSSISGTNALYLFFFSGGVLPAYSNYRAYGFSVRCRKDTGVFTRDTGTKYSGAASTKVVAAANDEPFTQVINVGDTNTYSLTSYAYTDGSAVTSADLELYYQGNAISTTYTSVGSGWYRLNGTVTGEIADRSFGVTVKAGKTVYVDSFSVVVTGGVSALNITNANGDVGLNVAGNGLFSPVLPSLVALTLKGGVAQTADLLQFKNNAGTVLSTFNKDGWLGIGTSTPTENLTVNNADGGTAINIIGTDGTEIVGLGECSAGTGALCLKENNVMKARIQALGDSYVTNNFGIGTVSPKGLLEVNQVTTGAGRVTVVASNTTVVGSSGTQFTNNFKVGDTITANGETHTVATITDDTHLTTDAWTASKSFATYTLVGGSRMTVLGNGNVGIGTTTPNSLFSVQGNGYLSGNLFVGGTVTSTSTTATSTMPILQVASRFITSIISGFIPFVEGMLGIDSANNLLKYFSNGTVRTIAPDFDKSMFVASTTPDGTSRNFTQATTSYAVWNPTRASTLNSFYCKTDVGTVNLRMGDGTNWTTMGICDSTGITVTPASNNTFTAREDVTVEIGTPSGNSNKVTITSNWAVTP